MPLPQATATRLSALLLAAHQPLWSLWNLAAFTNTPLEQAALAFLPSARGEEERRETAALLLGMVSQARWCCWCCCILLIHLIAARPAVAALPPQCCFCHHAAIGGPCWTWLGSEAAGKVLTAVLTCQSTLWLPVVVLFCCNIILPLS